MKVCCKMVEFKKEKLGCITTSISRGITPSYTNSEGICIINQKCIRNGKVSFDEVRISKGKLLSKEKIIEKTDILICSTGVGTLGRVGRFNDFPENKTVTADSHVTIVKADKTIICPFFLSYVLVSKQADIEALAKGSTGQTELPKNELKLLEIPLPPLDVQRKIAGILGALDDKIEVLRAQNKTLEQMAQAVFQSWFVDFDIVRAKAAGLPAADVCKKYHITPDIYDLFPSAFSADNLPLGWEKKKLGDEFKITMGQSPSGDTYNEEKNGIPFFQGRRDFGFRYPMKRVYCTSPTRFAEKGDVLVSVRAPVGDLNIANFKCCIGRGVAAVHHYTDSTAYAFYHLKNLSNDFDVFNGDGTVFGCIGKDGFLNLNFISCPQETLIKLLPHLDLFENKIYENSEQIRTLEQTRDTLLPQLISGKIEV